MPGFICTPELARNIHTANAVFADAKKLLYPNHMPPAPFQTFSVKELSNWHAFFIHQLQRRQIHHTDPPHFWEIINLQDIVYRKMSSKSYGIQSQSLLAQFCHEFSSEKMSNIDQYHGILFIDFDNTIFNYDMYMKNITCYTQAAKLTGKSSSFVLPHDLYYNGINKGGWFELLASLKTKKFFIVLCSNRSVSEKDSPYQKMREELGHLIDSEIFMSSLGGKGYLMDMVRDYIRKNYNREFSRKSIYLVDDRDENLKLAQSLNFRTIKTWSFDPMQLAIEPIGDPKMHLSPQSCYTHILRMTNAELLKGLIPSVQELPLPQFITELNALPIPETPITYIKPKPQILMPDDSIFPASKLSAQVEVPTLHAPTPPPPVTVPLPLSLFVPLSPTQKSSACPRETIPQSFSAQDVFDRARRIAIRYAAGAAEAAATAAQYIAHKTNAKGPQTRPPSHPTMGDRPEDFEILP